MKSLAGNEQLYLYHVGLKIVAQTHYLWPFFGNSSEKVKAWTGWPTKETRVGAAMMKLRIQSTANLFPLGDGKRFSTSTPKTRLQVPASLATLLHDCEVLLVLLDICELPSID